MAITNVALVGNQGLGHTAKVHFLNLFDCDLDALYPANGYASFSTTVKGVIGTDKTIIAILQHGHVEAGGAVYDLKWDRVNDKLVVSTGGAQVAGGVNLAALTNIELVVFSK